MARGQESDIVKIWVDDHFGKERKIPMDFRRESSTRPTSMG